MVAGDLFCRTSQQSADFTGEVLARISSASLIPALGAIPSAQGKPDECGRELLAPFKIGRAQLFLPVGDRFERDIASVRSRQIEFRRGIDMVLKLWEKLR